MPQYVSKQAIIDRYGEDFLSRMADRNDDQDLDEDPVDRAIRDAESEVDSYIGVVHSLPLPGVTDRDDPENNSSVPYVLRRVCIDITVYRLASEHDELTKERRRRYEDAIAWLMKVSESKVSLGIPTDVAETAPSGVKRYGPNRIFTRDDTDGLV